MKQMLQNLSTGETIYVEAPMPIVKAEEVIIRTSKTLISAGTERMLINFSQANLINKARQQPEKVQQVFSKVMTDGILTTFDAVSSKINEPIPLGYSNVGVIEQVGKNVVGLKIGDRVVSSGAHADIVSIPENFVAKIPDNVNDEDATYTIVSSIAMQGIRLAKPEIGEVFVVIGVGLIGLIAVQILIAGGCKVLAVDHDKSKLEIAESFGAETFNLSKHGDISAVVQSLTDGYGADGVLVCAATEKSDPMNIAAKVLRIRGRVIQVGVTGLNLKRPEFYSKEIEVRVSCSFGPGRYDSSYSEQGLDYPIGFVRWTAKRNFEAVLQLLSSGKLLVSQLTSNKYSFDAAADAYKNLSNNSGMLGIILEYPSERSQRIVESVALNSKARFNAGKPSVAFIGAGNYASRVLIPAFKEAKFNFQTILSSGGINGARIGANFGFEKSSNNLDSILRDKSINTLVIATRHDSHAELIYKGLEHHKNVFVEKPLALSLDEIEKIQGLYADSSKSGKPVHLMVGFNRRFSPQIKKTKELLDGRSEPISVILTVNAGYIPADHWLQDPAIGGGRIIGEGCHFIDLMRFIVGKKILSVNAISMGDHGQPNWGNDKVSITLTFVDGSFGTIHYFANGANTFPKERVEVFSGGKVIQIDNYRKMKAYGFSNFSKMNLWRQDKGQNSCVREFGQAIENGLPTPISAEEIFEVSRVVIDASNQISCLS
jgi:predicted dehydrogenase/threonine dehydrogenase-like Zn-dependent dehydrogenase